MKNGKAFLLPSISSTLAALLKDWDHWRRHKMYKNESLSYSPPYHNPKRDEIYRTSKGLCEVAHRCHPSERIDREVDNLVDKVFGCGSFLHFYDNMSKRPYWENPQRIIFFQHLLRNSLTTGE